MSVNRDAIKKLNDMIVDSQFAQQMGVKVFNGQATHEECAELQKAAEDLISAIKVWKEAIPFKEADTSAI